MPEKELISRIKELKGIKPRQEWVVLTKSRILGEQPIPRGLTSGNFWGVFHWKKTIFAGAGALALLVVFAVSQSALPGDWLYSVKKITERGKTAFVSASDKPRASIELANKRLEELTEIAKNNQVKRLAPAINEFQANVSIAAKDLAKVSSTTSDPVKLKEIVEASKKLEASKQRVEAMGIVVGGTEELTSAMAGLVEREIKEMESRNLTENQQKALVLAKEAFQSGDYSGALEQILLMLP